MGVRWMMKEKMDANRTNRWMNDGWMIGWMMDGQMWAEMEG